MKIKTITIAIVLTATLFSATLISKDAFSLSGSEFNPGRIIDDAVFYNSGSMDVGQIQTFLNSKQPVCDTYGSQPASDWQHPEITRAQLAERIRTTGISDYNDGNPDPGFHAPPYTCLKDYRSNTPQIESASGYCATIPAGTNQSAAQMIYSIARACGINPQVFIVLLEKEQSLVTDAWPLDRQFKSATGFACPDTADCNPAYAGLFQQLYNAGKQFKIYQANPTHPDFNYRAGRSQRIYYQTNQGSFINPTGNANDPSRTGQSACGYQNVYIENQATAALYIYTPYQPNQAALANLYSTGDECSAYGNRNFWSLFNGWFGPTSSYIIRTYEDGKMYMIGQGNTYYYITSSDQLKNIGYGLNVNRVLNTSISYLNSMTNAGDLPNAVRFGDSSEVYLIDSGNRYYMTYDIYQSFGTPAVGNLPSTYYNSLYDAPNLSSVIRQYGNSNLYTVQSGKRHYIGGPMIYNSNGYSSQPITFLSSFTIQNIPIGAPLLPAGTLTKSNDTQQYSIIKTNTQTQQPISSIAAKSLTIPIYIDTSLALSQISISGSSATLLVKDVSNNLYLIDGTSKYNISASQLQSLGKTPNDFVLVDDSFLSNLVTRISNSQSLLVRVAWTSTVYNVINGELFKISSLQDFNALGYNFNDVLDISKNTLDNLFINQGRLMVTNGSLFRIDTDPTVYVMGYDSKTHVIQSGDVFNDYGFKYSDVLSINSQTFQNLTPGNTLQNFFSAPDGSEWGVSNGSRYWITPSLSSQYRTSTDLYTPLISNNINHMRIGKNLTNFIRINNSKNVYYVTGSTKQLLNSPSAFASNGGTDWNEVLSVSQAFANNLPDGPILY